MRRTGSADDHGTRLLFVYNADGGAASALMDAVHKIVSPQTYACSLCFITYGAVSMRREWNDYVSRLPFAAEFLHRDEFHAAYPGLQVDLPAILLTVSGAAPKLLVPASAMHKEQSVADLRRLLDQALADQAGQRV